MLHEYGRGQIKKKEFKIKTMGLKKLYELIEYKIEQYTLKKGKKVKSNFIDEKNKIFMIFVQYSL